MVRIVSIPEKNMFKLIKRNLVRIARGVFYLDSGHSFDNVLFYGNDFVLFQYELMVFMWIFVMTNSYVAGILGTAGIQQVCGSIIQLFMNLCLLFQISIRFYSMSPILELNGTYLGKR